MNGQHCGRPTRAGNPCQEWTVFYPVPLPSCPVHLTPAERATVDRAHAARRTIAWRARAWMGGVADRAAPAAVETGRALRDLVEGLFMFGPLIVKVLVLVVLAVVMVINVR